MEFLVKVHNINNKKGAPKAPVDLIFLFLYEYFVKKFVT